LCLECAPCLVQEKSSGFAKEEEFTSDFKEDLRFDEVPNAMNNDAEDNRRAHGRATGVHDYAPRVETCPAVQPGARPAVCGRTVVLWWTATRAYHARPCVPRTAVRGCTATRGPMHGQPCVPARSCHVGALSDFAFSRAINGVFASFFRGFSQTSLEHILGKKLGLV